jgi:hypothetical protein
LSCPTTTASSPSGKQNFLKESGNLISLYQIAMEAIGESSVASLSVTTNALHGNSRYSANNFLEEPAKVPPPVPMRRRFRNNLIVLIIFAVYMTVCMNFYIYYEGWSAAESLSFVVETMTTVGMQSLRVSNRLKRYLLTYISACFV